MPTGYITKPRIVTGAQLEAARAHLQANAVDYDLLWQALEDDAGLSSSLDFAAALVGMADEIERLHAAAASTMAAGRLQDAFAQDAAEVR